MSHYFAYMLQFKIGKFISECRKEKNLTQMQLAEKLDITNKAISKWETEKSMPDASNMLTLCKILDITVTDLLNGEKIEPENFCKIANITILDFVKNDKKLKRQKVISEMMGGVGVGLLLSILYAPDTTKKMIIAIVAFLMICCGWYCRAKIEKSNFSYPVTR